MPETRAASAFDAAAGLDDVACDLVLDGEAAGRGRITVLHLGWRRADPLAVQLRLTASPDHPCLPRGEWVVLRDFLQYGLEEATGDGEVRIRPLPGAQVCFELLREGRPVLAEVPAGDVRGFLDQTYAQVPAGEESSDEEMSVLLERLLSR